MAWQTRRNAKMKSLQYVSNVGIQLKNVFVSVLTVVNVINVNALYLRQQQAVKNNTYS